MRLLVVFLVLLAWCPAKARIRQRSRRSDSKDGRFLDTSFEYCKRPAKCEPLETTTCMGAKLPYHSTTLELTDLNSQEKVQDKLMLYQYLRFIPKCWAVIQPFLCALYMPKCRDGTVELPSREMCKITLEPCKILYNSSVFPEFLNCDDKVLFPPNCTSYIQELKFNTTGFCMDPLVKTDKPEWFYPDVEGCGHRCKDSLYTENEQNQIHKLIAYCVLICISFNLFTILTFIIDWNTGNKYPALAIFYVNVCFCISYTGWLIQFLGSDTREDVVCKKDGTLRKAEPSATENLSCVIVFVMVYYFLIAGMVWFVIFSYAWHMSSLQALGKIRERVDRKRAYFHLVAWSLPLILTITTMAIGEIDGDYVTGICFVGFVSKAARNGLLLTPLAGVMMASGYVIVRGLILLIKVKIDSREYIPQHSSRKIRSNIVRMGVFAIFMIVFCVITFGYHIYIADNSSLWDKSLQSYIMCKLTSLSSDYSHCKQEARPSVAMLQLQLLAVFGAGIAMASWVWCDATIHAWGRYIRRKFHCEIKKPVKLQKHKIIAQAFDKRQIFNEGGRISILCQHTDPVGLRFTLNSGASNEWSASWAAKLPRLINRRGALVPEYSLSSNNLSIDSEVSVNYRHVSIESRRNSGDSQLSVQISEVKATRKVKSRRRRTGQKHFRSTSRNIGSYYSSRRHSRSETKHGSSTSLDSHLQIINNAWTCGGHSSSNFMPRSSFGPNLSRRTGNAGLDGHPPLSQMWPQIRSGSEDENVSITISESKYHHHLHTNMDLNDQLMVESLRKGCQIEELNTSSDSDNARQTDKDYTQEKHHAMQCGRESHESKRSKRSRKSRKKYSSYSDSFEDNKRSSSSDSSCPEIKQLVQSSLNSGVSEGSKNRGSRQSKASIDVGVQTNPCYLEMQPLKSSDKEEDHPKAKQKSKESKKYRRSTKYHESNEKPKKHYKNLNGDLKNVYYSKDSNRRATDLSDEEGPLLIPHIGKCKGTTKRSKEVV